MKVKVNGKEEILDKDQMTVGDLLKICKVEQPEMVSVQVNSEFVKTADLTVTRLKDGDEVDFLYFMGGGLSV